MLENIKHENTNCAFGDELVSYLYGECSADEHKKFEKHLNLCGDCHKEFAGFSAARSLVSEWRDQEFLPLEIPSFVLSTSKETNFKSQHNLKNLSRSWLTDIQSFLTFSPAVYAFGIVAILMFLFGVLFFGGNAQNNEFASIKNQNTEQIETFQKSGIQTELKETEQNQLENQNGNEMSKQSFVSTAAVSQKNNQYKTFSRTSLVSKNSVSNISGKLNLKSKSSNQTLNYQPVKSGNVENNKPIFAQNSRPPRLNTIEDEEDKSLRLAELLDDSETK